MSTTRKVTVTFHEGDLPGGTYATFKHKDETYVCWPLRKHQAHLVVVDRLLGALHSLRRTCLDLINADPHEAARVSRLLEIIRRAEVYARENAAAKVEVQTS